LRLRYEILNMRVGGCLENGTRLFSQTFNAIAKTYDAKAKKVRRPAPEVVPAAAIIKDALAVRIDKQTGQVLIYPMEDFRKVVEINIIAPIYWAMELVAAVAKDRASRGLKRWQPEEGMQGAVVFLGSIASIGKVGQIS